MPVGRGAGSSRDDVVPRPLSSAARTAQAAAPFEAAEIRSRWAVEVGLSTFNDAGHVRDDVDSTDDGRHHAVSLGRAKMRS